MGDVVHDITLTGQNEIAAVNAIDGISVGSTGKGGLPVLLLFLSRL